MILRTLDYKKTPFKNLSFLKLMSIKYSLNQYCRESKVFEDFSRSPHSSTKWIIGNVNRVLFSGVCQVRAMAHHHPLGKFHFRKYRPAPAGTLTP
jgi:hypothetical protein